MKNRQRATENGKSAPALEGRRGFWARIGGSKASEDNNDTGPLRFGTFGGVFIPSILTILGVILFMRANFVIGQASIIHAAVILLIAKFITFSKAIRIVFETRSPSPFPWKIVFDSANRIGIAYFCSPDAVSRPGRKKDKFGRARGGVGGALYLQSASAGRNSPPRPLGVGVSRPHGALIPGSRATSAFEPGQAGRSSHKEILDVCRGGAWGEPPAGSTPRFVWSKRGARSLRNQPSRRGNPCPDGVFFRVGRGGQVGQVGRTG